MRFVAALIVLSSVLYADPIPFTADTSEWDSFGTTALEDEGAVGEFASVRLTEDSASGFTSFYNDPSLMDTVIPYAGGAATLEFDWELEVDGDIQFYIDLIDVNLPFPGFVGGPDYSVFETSSGSGHESWDLEALGSAGPFGFNVDLVSFNFPAGSSFARISNLQLVVPAGPPPGVIPEPGTYALFSLAFVGYVFYRRRRAS